MSTTTVTLSDHFARAVPEMAVAWEAEPVAEPRLLVLNEPLAAELGLDVDWLRSAEGLAFLVGTHVPAGARPVAQAYAGHQFGHYSPRLGDGRALLLGELVHADGGLRDLHLKGSGRTTFSRGGDGFAAVGPMLREYVISEAMHALGIPTTRSLAVVATGRPVPRETVLPGAVLARVASSHLRVGSFQYARATDDVDLLRRLADHAIERHYPSHGYLGLFESVLAAQASLVARWTLVGFVHGVMNTDNMTISGETIDYGPCAFLEAFDPATVFSSIDHGARYAFGNQPAIAEWNLARLAEALLPLLADTQEDAIAIAVESLGGFRRSYNAVWTTGMLTKLGLPSDTAPDFIDDLLALLHTHHIDYTLFHHHLTTAARGSLAPVRSLFTDPTAIDAWLTRWQSLAPDPTLMAHANPLYIPRNHRVEEALTAATTGDMTPFHHLLAAVQSPYTERSDLAHYATPAPDTTTPYQTFCGT
ncbi:protein adenylyltransferase SelO [Actinokineospora terrae]|uniref:Protein nucleotidyltransferase YdiU n=1 Tax=Actinokineospora terrae TaxID=155974 RepID=A0A1H9MXS2_9PSEU|nr:YdiU family protein [Actinokineospora terrae]SER27893.1 Uncharacterized conserved protein YdiU, UPF0061 family [Actinokineospora terrae]